MLADYHDQVSLTKHGERWERLRLDVVGKKKIDGRLFSEIKPADLRPAHITAWRGVHLREVALASAPREMTLLSHTLAVA